MDYCIRKLLGLTEENFITDENWLEIVTENHETVYKIKGTWTNSCASCLYCSSKNVIKHSPMEHKIRIPHLYENKTILDLKVQRFICKDCCKIWVVDCPLVPQNSNISYDLEYQIMLYLKENFSRKTIAKLLSISDKTVERVMKKFEVFRRFKNGIYQAFTAEYSNGAIEGTNNFIKVIKRVAYGYRNFENMKLRIKIIKGCFFTPVNRKSL